MHIDYDEANACLFRKDSYGVIYEWIRINRDNKKSREILFKTEVNLKTIGFRKDILKIILKIYLNRRNSR